MPKAALQASENQTGKQHMNLEYHKLTETDIAGLIELIKLYEDIFEEAFSMPSREYLQNLLKKEHVIFYTARAGNDVVGGLTAYVLPSVYFPASEVYIYDLAVKREHQRKGIGRQLIHELRTYCKRLGYREIFVQAHMEDQHALDFYQATGAEAESIMHYVYHPDK